ncbi:MAG: branched-chain amino acid aminotransferase [Planctomycetes bacterium]|nr:branched-chain amino acid aminotransferase [Planctomycetota bacterium]
MSSSDEKDTRSLLCEAPGGPFRQKTPGVFFVWVNGQVLRSDEPALSVRDRGLLYGDGVFETLRAYDGVPFLLDEHLHRLADGATELEICRVLDGAAIAEAITELLRLNELSDAYIRITLTRGEHTGRLELEPAASPTLIIVVQPLRPLPPSRYDPGSTAIIASRVRQSVDSPLPRHKTLNYLNNLLAKTEARDRGADEAILLNTRGKVAEAASSNIFLVRRGRLITPSRDSNILLGITRWEVVHLARKAGIATEERIVRPDELGLATEVFLTNSVAELVPVRAIEGRTVGQGRPGPLTRQLQAIYRDRVGQCAGAELAATTV